MRVGAVAAAHMAAAVSVGAVGRHESAPILNSDGAASTERLAVIVPAYRGDLPRAVSSLSRWPSVCSPVTMENVDLVLYYAEGVEDVSAVTEAANAIEQNAGKCFANTRTVYAHLDEEEDVYPKGPSVQFYKMFLDEDVRPQLAEYDALAIVEWDVLVASDRSFEELHKTAFAAADDYWVKGSTVGGTTFHKSAELQDMWHVLGHINGNAIYNNNDEDFVEYVKYTQARWQYDYPYDVALWLTISDFPYSWPLWQRYSSKFVSTNLISYVGQDHVDRSTVSDAVAGKTLFVHGSTIDDGNLASVRATKRDSIAFGRRGLRAAHDAEDDAEGGCTSSCHAGDDTSLAAGTSTVCDETCEGEDARFGGFMCGAGDSARFGGMCRLCYTDAKEARETERFLSNVGGDEKFKHVIMCDTMRPPEGDGCSDECAGNKNTVCDDTCGAGRFGDYNCNWRNSGDKCRFCFDDEDAAHVADAVALRHGGRVIMCSTMEPPQHASDAAMTESFDQLQSGRKLQKWKDNQRWKNLGKWSNPDDDTEPKWRTNQKWTNNRCLSGCEYTSKDGTRGRICDSSCKDGDPYGTNGCNAKSGQYGRYCRVCYNDVAKAERNDDPDDRAIMCSTGGPVETVYTGRRLTAAGEEEPLPSTRKLQKWKDGERWKDLNKWSNPDNGDEPKWRTNQKWTNNRCLSGCEYTSKDGTRGRICDSSCKDGDPYGTNGCNAKSGQYGRYCRVCYNDVAKAERNDDPDDRAIMCSTGGPIETVYTGRRLAALDSDPSPTRQLQKWKDNQRWKNLGKWSNPDDDTEPKWRTSQKWTNNRCLSGCEYTSKDGTRGRICDSSCKDGDPYGTNGCNAKSGQYGRYCRVCYNDVAKAERNDDPDDRAIMCATGGPIDTVYTGRRLSADEGQGAARDARKLQKWKDNQRWKNLGKWSNPDDDTEPKWRTNQKWTNNRCLSGCEYTSKDGTRGRICDSSCKDGDPYGTNGCNAKSGQYGRYCRVCYNDVAKAERNDDPDDRAIMCATGGPVETVYTGRRLASDNNESEMPITRNLQKWRDTERWKNLGKWSNPDDDTEPKWRTNQKWTNNRCLSGCEYTSKDGTRGRICDSSCKDGDPYGTNGCNAKSGQYGRYCRVCYNDVAKAERNDDPDDRAIMCATGGPIETVYTGRRLVTEDEIVQGVPGIEPEVESTSAVEMDELTQVFIENGAKAFTQELTRSSLCAFMVGRAHEVDMWEVTVESIMQFLPGMRVALAVEADAVDEYMRAFDGLPAVGVSPTKDATMASLFADESCGEGTELIFYVRRGSVVSRPITSKDTHSTMGDLLVVYGDDRASYRDAEITASVLGFQAPSFTHGTDLILPATANADLREALDAESLTLVKDIGTRHELAILQMLAALQYSRDTPGIWFINPSEWAAQHLFKVASIWEIPLVKPRFTCAVDGPVNSEEDVARMLRRNLSFFRQGGTCENGMIAGNS